MTITTPPSHSPAVASMMNGDFSPPFLVPPRARLAIALVAYLTLLALAVPDKYTQDLRAGWAEVVVAILLVLDLPALTAAGLRQIAKRLFFVAAAIGLTLVLAEALRRALPSPNVELDEILKELREAHCERIWPAVLWLFSPFVVDRRALRAADNAAPRWRTAIALTLVAFTGWCFVASWTSLDPERSFPAFETEVGIYAPMLLFWMRHAPDLPALRRWFYTGTLIVLMLGTLAGSATWLTFIAADDSLKRRMVEFEQRDSRIIDSSPTQNGYVPWRLVFPFGQHNRMAYFSMLATLAFALSVVMIGSRFWRTLMFAFALLAFLNLLMTLNRGVLLALVPAVAIGAWALLGRRSLALLLLIPIGFCILPATQQKRVLSIFRARTYSNPYSTVVLRIHHFQAASLMTLDHPLLGIGYGWSHMEQTYQSDYRDRVNLPPRAQGVHAHNIWLETAAETGLPGLYLWILFSAARWMLLWAAWRRRAQFTPAERRLLLGWIVIEIAIQVYSISNYPLRRSLGIVTWTLWSMMAADAIAMLARCKPPLPAPPAKY